MKHSYNHKDCTCGNSNEVVEQGRRIVANCVNVTIYDHIHYTQRYRTNRAMYDSLAGLEGVCDCPFCDAIRAHVFNMIEGIPNEYRLPILGELVF